MLIEVSKEEYRRHFTADPHLFVTEQFISLVEKRCDKVVRLMDENESSMGIILGMKGNIACSPFSAPFGGFHYSHEHLFYDIAANFIVGLKEYVVKEGLCKVCITLPPSLYQANMNAKLVNAFVRNGFSMGVPDITHWVDLRDFDGSWAKPVVEQNCRKAVKHGLTWSMVADKHSMEEAFAVILHNREEQDRKIHMTLDNLLDMKFFFPVDFCVIRDADGEIIATGVFYRGMEKIVTGVFLGDNMEKRNLGTMNYLYKNCFLHYKAMGFDFIDFGSSCLNGEPNVGLIRFKELHSCIGSLRYTFTWKP